MIFAHTQNADISADAQVPRRPVRPPKPQFCVQPRTRSAAPITPATTALNFPVLYALMSGFLGLCCVLVTMRQVGRVML
jgi:hypothetical protein